MRLIRVEFIMRVIPLLLLMIMTAFAEEECKEIGTLHDIFKAIPWDHIINTVKTGLAYAGGMGPHQALGIAAITQVFDALNPFAENGPDPLEKFIERYEKELEENTENIVVGFFQGEVHNSREIEVAYKEIFDHWVDSGRPKKELQYNSMHKFFSFGTRQHIESGLNRIIGNTNYNYYGIPMFSLMATGYLGILRDAVFIGNGYFDIPQVAQTDYRKIFQQRINRYSTFLLNAHANRVKKLNTLEKKLVFESTNILQAFDIAAQWTMFIPTTNISIPVDVVFTRPIYSKISECKGDKAICAIDENIFYQQRNIHPNYRAPLTSIEYDAIELNNHMYAFRAFKFNYADGGYYQSPDFNEKNAKKIITDKPVTEISVKYGIMNGFRSIVDDACKRYGDDALKICSGYARTTGDVRLGCFGTSKYCGRYPAQIVFNHTATQPSLIQGCSDEIGDIKVPQDHALTRIIPVQKRGSHNFRWVFEYHHVPKRINFDGVTSNRAIRFPGDYVLFNSERNGNSIVNDYNYLLGGRVVEMFTQKVSITYTLPPKTNRVRIYAKGVMSLNGGCKVQKQHYTFAGFDIYEGDCTSLKITIGNGSGPYKEHVAFFLGAVEAIHLVNNNSDKNNNSPIDNIIQTGEQIIGTAEQAV